MWLFGSAFQKLLDLTLFAVMIVMTLLYFAVMLYPFNEKILAMPLLLGNFL